MATFRIITKEEDFLALKPNWDALFGGNRRLRFFQGFDWNYQLWQRLYKGGSSRLFVKQDIFNNRR